jgi:hypothetical protein
MTQSDPLQTVVLERSGRSRTSLNDPKPPESILFETDVQRLKVNGKRLANKQA